MNSEISVATANTYVGQMLVHPEGLAPFQEANVDVLLLQEVLRLDTSLIESRLLEGGYTLAALHALAGLAIALRIGSSLTLSEGSGRYEPLEWQSRVGRLAHRHSRTVARHHQPRGLLSVQLTTAAGQNIMVATTHASVFVLHRSRVSQLIALKKLLKETHSPERPFILGADMNHYPKAGRHDLDLLISAQLKVAEILEPTWRVRHSKHEWLAKIGALATRRSLDSFDAQLDALLYRGDKLALESTRLMDIESDHRAIVGRFTIG